MELAPYQQRARSVIRNVVRNQVNKALADPTSAYIKAAALGKRVREVYDQYSGPSKRSKGPTTASTGTYKGGSRQVKKGHRRMARRGNRGGGALRKPRFTSTRGKRRGGKRRHHKPKGYIVSTKQVKKWNRAAVNALIDISTMHWQERSVNQSICGLNESSFNIESLAGFGLAGLRDAIDQRKIQNDAAVAVNLTQNVTTQEASNKIKCKVASSAHWCNNFAVPFWADVYCFVPAVDHNITPATAFTNGMEDLGLVDGDGGPSVTSHFAYPTSSPVLRQIWKIASHKRVCLAPGESLTLGYHRSFTYDNSVQDAHISVYQTKLGAHVFGVRLEGCFGHATADPTQLGTGTASCDWYVDRHVEVKYDAGGAKYKTYEYTDGATAETAVINGWPTNAENTTGTNT